MKIALGTVQFGMKYGVANTTGKVDFDDAHLILQRAANFGINTLDTAIVYGESESVLGQLGIGGWNAITKLPPVPEGCQDIDKWMFMQLRQSLDRMRLEKLEAVLLHRPNQLFDPIGRSLYSALKNMKDLGMTRKIGVSVYETADIKSVSENYSMDVFQAPFNILDRDLVDSGWARRLNDSGIEVHIRSVFLQGLLLMSERQLPEKFLRWSALWSVWHDWLKREGLTPIQACIRYVLNFSEIDRVIIGVDSVNQLNQIINAVGGPLVNLPKFSNLTDTRIINPARWNEL